MMYHAIYDGGSDNRVSKIIANVLEVNVGSDWSGAFAVTPVYDLEKQRGVPCVLLLQSVKAYLINQEDVGQGILSEFSMEAVIGPACQQIIEHVGCYGISAKMQLSESDEKQRLCNMTLSGAGVPRDHKLYRTVLGLRGVYFHTPLADLSA